jgi:hypothetical protein
MPGLPRISAMIWALVGDPVQAGACDGVGVAGTVAAGVVVNVGNVGRPG